MTRRDVRALAASFLAILAAVLSESSLGIAGADGGRIGVLPVSIAVVAAALAAGVAVGWLARAGASLAPLSLFALVLLPWLPLPLPATFLIWSGSIRWLLWGATLCIMVATSWPRGAGSRTWAPVTALVRNKPQLAAGVFAFAIFAFSAWQVSPLVPSGDEPHYLVITQSLLLDRDIKIENNHRRGDYQAYYTGTLPPHYIRHGKNGEIYSIHAPGLSALVAPAFALGGYRAVVWFLVAIAACGSALAWYLARLESGSVAGAWFGWAAVTCAATTIFHSFTIYPDGVGGVIVLTGVWALLRADEDRRSGDERLLPWLLHGMALALLPWLHSRFAVLAGCLGALVLLRLSSTRNAAAKAAAFLSVPAVSAMAWMTFFRVIYGIADPSAPYGPSREFSLSFIPGGLTGLLFDQRFGLIANAPVMLVALAGLVMMLMQQRRVAGDVAPPPGLADRRLALELTFVMVPYLMTATSYAMWWAGWSAPARFANPAVFILAIPAAFAWSRIRNCGSRAVAAGLLVVTVFMSWVLVTVDDGRLAYNTRETTALWLDWASGLVALADGVPIWFRGRESAFTVDIAIWGVALILAWLAARSLASRSIFADRGRFLTGIAAVHLAAGMAALTVVWDLHGSDPVLAAPAELDVLRALARESRTVAVQISPPGVISKDRMLARLVLEPTVRPGGPARGRADPTVAVLPELPAGRYRLAFEGGGAGGWIMIGIGQDQFALRSEAIAWPASPIEIDFPVDVRALIIRGDEDARRAIRRVVVEPLSVVPAATRLTDAVASRAVKYASVALFFLDERSFPEPEGFWLGGSRQSTFVVQPDRPSASVTLLVRNAPVDNRVTFESGQWREEVAMAAGEERHIQVPLGPGQTAALVSATVASGFRPSQSVPDSRDDRFLGVWVQPR